MRISILLILMAFSAGKLHTQDIPAKLDHYLETELKKFNVPGIAILIVKDTSIVYARSMGRPSNLNTPFYLGSVSKSLTAFGTLRLVDAGKLSLEQKVTEFLPHLKFDQYEKEITVRTLLNHTSGISKEDGFSRLPSLNELETTPYQITIDSKPATKHVYSNLNYAILGLVVEKASGVPFAEYMKQEVFAPLHMNNTSANCDKGSIAVADQYQYWFGYPVKSNQASYSQSAVPAGFICSSAEDMKHYISVNLHAGIFEYKQIISSHLLRTMHTPWNGETYGYAMGWKQGSINNKIFLQHLGSTATSYAGLFIIPEEKTGFVLLTNSNSLSFTEGILKGILQILTGSKPESVSNSELYIRIGVGILCLFLVGQCIFKIIRIYQNPATYTRQKTVRSLIISLLLGTGFVFLFPLVAHIPFVKMISIQPDIGTAILLSLTFPIIINVAKLTKIQSGKAEPSVGMPPTEKQ